MEALQAVVPKPVTPHLDKRLLHVIRSVSPAGGGPAMGIEELANATMQANGAAMEVVSLDDPAENFVRSRAYPIHALGPSRGHYGYTPHLTPWIRENLARFDGVILHGLWQYHGYGSYLALRGRTPYAIFPHGMLDPYFRHAFPLKHLRKQAYWILREYRVVRDATAVCFTTPIERDCSTRTMWPYRARPAVVSFGAPMPTGDVSRQKRLFFETFPQLEGRRFFLLLARIHPKKGCDLAIEALSRLIVTDPDFDLVIAGPDEAHLQPRLTHLAASLGVGTRVHWTGMISGDLKWGALRSAEAFLLPSHQENFCIAAAEALALEVPVLISNKVNIWPDLVEDQAGIVDEDTVEGALRSMLKLLRMTGDERQRMTANGLAAFHARYEMIRTAQALNDLFR